MNHETAKEAEVVAKRLAKQAGQPEGMFELFLIQAYDDLAHPLDNDKLTVEKLKAIVPGTRFATGQQMDSPNGINIANTGNWLKWIAVKGHGHDDWCIYAHFASMDDAYIVSAGDKVCDENNIRRCVPCDDDALALYRR